MKLLAIDTSTNRFSVAVSQDEKILAEKNIVLTKVLENSIIPVIDEVLKKAKVSLSQLEGFAVGLGPGSFTSLRVGLSTVKAFCLATGKPVVGISSLDIIADGFRHKGGYICVLTDARRNMVYGCLYQADGESIKRRSDYLLVPVEEILGRISEDTVFAGDAVEIYKGRIISDGKNKFNAVFAPKNSWRPDSRHLIRLSLKRFKVATTDNPHKLLPLYLYPEDCQVNKGDVIKVTDTF